MRFLLSFSFFFRDSAISLLRSYSSTDLKKKSRKWKWIGSHFFDKLPRDKNVESIVLCFCYYFWENVGSKSRDDFSFFTFHVFSFSNSYEKFWCNSSPKSYSPNNCFRSNHVKVRKIWKAHSWFVWDGSHLSAQNLQIKKLDMLWLPNCSIHIQQLPIISTCFKT